MSAQPTIWDIGEVLAPAATEVHVLVCGYAVAGVSVLSVAHITIREHGGFPVQSSHQELMDVQ